MSFVTAPRAACRCRSQGQTVLARGAQSCKLQLADSLRRMRASGSAMGPRADSTEWPVRTAVAGPGHHGACVADRTCGCRPPCTTMALYVLARTLRCATRTRPGASLVLTEASQDGIAAGAARQQEQELQLSEAGARRVSPRAANFRWKRQSHDQSAMSHGTGQLGAVRTRIKARLRKTSFMSIKFCHCAPRCRAQVLEPRANGFDLVSSRQATTC